MYICLVVFSNKINKHILVNMSNTYYFTSFVFIIYLVSMFEDYMTCGFFKRFK